MMFTGQSGGMLPVGILDGWKIDQRRNGFHLLTKPEGCFHPLFGESRRKSWM